MNWITVGRYVWCVNRQRVIRDVWAKDEFHECEGPHRPVAVLLHSLDEYKSPKEREEVTVQIEGAPVAAARYLCDFPDHVAKKLVCTRATKGYSTDELAKVEELKLGEEVLKHHWAPITKDWKPGQKEESTKPGLDLQYFDTMVPVSPEQYYCVLYDHVVQRQHCTIFGYQHVPKDDTHGYHQANAFKKGERSTYVRFIEREQSVAQQIAESIVGPDLVEQVAEELVKPENAELLEAALDSEDGRITTGEFLRGEGLKETPEPILRKKHLNAMGLEKPLKEGDWVLIRGQILDLNNEGLVVAVASHRGPDELVHPAVEEIIATIQAPTPEEPHPGNLLVSEASGRVFEHSQGSGTWSAGWHDAGVANADRYSWKMLWSNHGPFREYYASRLLRGTGAGE